MNTGQDDGSWPRHTSPAEKNVGARQKYRHIRKEIDEEARKIFLIDSKKISIQNTADNDAEESNLYRLCVEETRSENTCADSLLIPFESDELNRHEDELKDNFSTPFCNYEITFVAEDNNAGCIPSSGPNDHFASIPLTKSEDGIQKSSLLSLNTKTYTQTILLQMITFYPVILKMSKI